MIYSRFIAGFLIGLINLSNILILYIWFVIMGPIRVSYSHRASLDLQTSTPLGWWGKQNIDVLNGCTATWRVIQLPNVAVQVWHSASTNVYTNVMWSFRKQPNEHSECLEAWLEPGQMGNLYLRGSISSPIGNCTEYVVAPSQDTPSNQVQFLCKMCAGITEPDPNPTP